MAIPLRTDQSASDVATGEATKVEHYNNLRDDVDLAQTEFDKGTAAEIVAVVSPEQGQAAIDTDNNLLYVSVDGIDFHKVAPVSCMAGYKWSNFGVGVATYMSWGGDSSNVEIAHIGRVTYDCVFKNVYVKLDKSIVAPDWVTVSLKKNGSPAGLTATIQDASDGEDTGIEISFVAGDEFVWVHQSGHSPAEMNGNTSWEIVDNRTL